MLDCFNMQNPGARVTTLGGIAFLPAALLTTFMLFSSTGKAEVVRTGYTSIIAANSSKCLDIYGGSSAAGAAAIQLYCTSSASQQWTVQNYNGSFRILQQQTGDCLVIAGGSTTAGAQLVQEPCTGVTSELWSFVASGANFQIVSKSSAQCASVSGSSNADSAYIVQEPCSTSSNFLWTFFSGLITSSSLSVLQAAHSGQCMVVSSDSTAVGGVIVQYPCAGVTDEQWTLLPTGAFYELVAKNSGLCLFDNGGSAPGANIIQSTCSATNPSDLWTLTPVGGSYELVASDSGLCVTVPGASQTAATTLVPSACTGVQNQIWSLSAATLPSSWAGVISLPVNPVAAANLPNGQLVMWSANDQYIFEGDIGYGTGQTYTAVFDPSSGNSTEVLVTNTGDDMFCPGTANLFNGYLLVNGGDSSPKTVLYNPTTGLWTSDADMNVPRGYEGDAVLTNGSVMTFGGSWSGGLGGKTAEVWTEGSGWTLLPGVPEDSIVGPDPQGIYRGDNHLWLFSAPNGQVFHAGPSAQMHWITTSGSGTITSAGNRGNDPYVINGNAVLYDVGLIMKAGGAPAYQDANAEANAYLININNGVNGVTVTQLAPMAYPRAFSNGTVLPNGQVVISGGQTYALPDSDSTAILIPEIWDPQTQVFRQLSPMQKPRVYHSTGILLSDGRVYEGGGGLCGYGCSANHLDTEILTPPYLLNADGSAATRPVITAASSTVALGGTITAATSSPVVSFVLMRLSSVTHTTNNDQRRIPLQMQSTNGTSYVLQVPSNPGIVLPGNYWLFALNAQGVPSVAANVMVTLGAPAESFALTPTPATVTTYPGSGTTSTITLADAGGFSGAVTLAAYGLPTGVTASFGTNPATSSSVVTLAASSSATANTSAVVTITGTSGSLTASTAIALNIGTANCAPTPIIPYLQVNGASWQQTATTTVASGSTVTLGPQPSVLETWSWTGPNGFTSANRELQQIPLSSGANTFVATYTNPSGCSSNQTFVITVTGSTGFILSPSPSSLSLPPGSSVSSTITVGDAGTFSGAVTLAVSGLPTGVTALFDTNPTTSSSVITLIASSSAAAGTSTVTITGTSGSLTASTAIALTVGSTSATSFTLSPSSSGLAVNPGSSGTDTVTVAAVNGFSGSVTLAASGLPTGVTASFGTNPTTASSVITLAASSSAADGTSTVTITGTSGSLTANTAIALTIDSGACTAIIPYMQVNGGAWQETATATVASGSTVNLGPQAGSGTWSWTGPNGFTSTAREIDGIPLSSGANTFVATYSTGTCSSTETFVVTVTGSSGFTLSPSAPSLSVTAGSTGTDTITVAPVNGFSGSVTLAASGLPTGVTASFGTNPATTSSLVTFTASSSAAAGTSTVTITGTSGSLTANTAIALTIAGACPITPYMQVNGAAWQQTATATVASGSTVNLGPQPFNGTWSWTGPNGFTSAAREIDGIPLNSGANTFVATYTSPSACSSSEPFVVTVSSGASFTLSPSAPSLSVAPGSSGTDTVTVAPVNGFSGSVTLAASGLPTGVTASFGTNPTTASSVITFTASSSAANGTSTVTITGTSGSLTASTAIALTIGSSSCPITPYMQVNGAAWQQTATATVASGSTVNLGPQPLNGTWSWNGPNGFTSAAREIRGSVVCIRSRFVFCSGISFLTVIGVKSRYSLHPEARLA